MPGRDEFSSPLGLFGEGFDMLARLVRREELGKGLVSFVRKACTR